MQPTRALFRTPFRKWAITTKDVNKGFYKGTRTGTVGRHTKQGGFKIDYSKVRTYVCPSLKDFKLTPFVTEKMMRLRGQYSGDSEGPRSPALYLERWKAENGLD